ncbi:uncharacterized protein HMPREF1541_03259 [Cyphellophora europaea CBS 101466]|uniref:Uncharacterized protein n=1 Tax=Cyphellophora europaea (strain CBS 101466) TaxID=1220924 RepID=W2S050_CYPE1|nr:uncharacterized protein HMPREF1541_03259 [Cyphellophora europaea CBS 101466]ETN41324.1 hypothetical protein HMPREF1541_03259 [Cyphellophora europaea CBS 101466]
MALVYSPEVPSGKTTPQNAPPSPTLTNPDMILPRSYTSFSSPSPDRLIASSPILRHADFTLPPELSSSPPEPRPDIGGTTTAKMRAKPVAPSSQYSAFSGYEHGAPLSDIGEEETIASQATPRSKFTRQSRSPSPVEPLSPIPNAISNADETPRERRQSDAASSDGSDIGDWENFDSSKMMSGRLAADVAKQEEKEALSSKRNSTVSIIDRDEMAILNDKAEEILANARKRLTHMEDNLSKARHSTLWSPRSSPNISEYHQQPAGSLYRSISLAGANKRYSRPVISTSSPSHIRGSSDTTPTGLKRLSMIPEARASSAQEYGSKPESPYSRPSAAARLTAQSPSSSQSISSPMRALEEEEDDEQRSPSTSKTSPETSQPRGLGIDTGNRDHKEHVRSAVSPTLARSASVNSLSRPESAASTRSIRESMSDLRLRISDIKAKAQADRERRSHNRNTPSPFTNANPENWYTSSPEYKQGGSPINANAGQGWSPHHTRENSLDAQVTPQPPRVADLLQPETPQTILPLTPGGRTDQNTPNLRQTSLKPIPEAHDSVLEQSQYEDAIQNFDDDEPIAASEEEQIYLNEMLEESLHDVESNEADLTEHMLVDSSAERHEDRLDAFDYENMFLHSAMGNYRGREGEETDSDTASVETSRADQSTPTAGQYSDLDEKQQAESDNDAEDDEEGTEVASLPTPKALEAPAKPWLNDSMRSNSVMSVSTQASFATATEGDSNGLSDDEEDDEPPREILNWGNNVHGFPTPPLTSPRRETGPGNTFQFPTRTTAPLSPPQQQRSGPVTLQEAPVLHVVTGNGQHHTGIPTPPVRSPANSVSSRSVRSPRSLRSGQPTPGSPSEAPSDHPANTEILMESLIKLADPDFKAEPPSSVASPASGKVSSPALSMRSGVFAEVDKELVLALLREVGQVCNGVLKAEKRRQGDQVKALRERLDAARQVLEGNNEQQQQ